METHGFPHIPGSSHCPCSLRYTWAFNTSPSLLRCETGLCVVRSCSAKGDTKFLDRLWRRLGGIGTFVRVGCERRVLAGDRLHDFRRIGFVNHLRPASADTGISSRGPASRSLYYRP